MTLRYAKLDSIIKRLQGRITIVDIMDYGITGITGTQVGTDLLYIIGDTIEDFMDNFIGMLYELPLILEHPFIQGIAEKLIIYELYISYFPVQGDPSESNDSFWGNTRQQALNDFQSLFDGTGIFVPGATNTSQQTQNDETRAQLQVKNIILRGEKLKSYIGYDFDGDSIIDTDLYKMNSNVPPSFYTTGTFDKLEQGAEVINNVRVRPKDYEEDRVDIDFW